MGGPEVNLSVLNNHNHIGTVLEEKKNTAGGWAVWNTVHRESCKSLAKLSCTPIMCALGLSERGILLHQTLLYEHDL